MKKVLMPWGNCKKSAVPQVKRRCHNDTLLFLLRYCSGIVKSIETPGNFAFVAENTLPQLNTAEKKKRVVAPVCRLFGVGRVRIPPRLKKPHTGQKRAKNTGLLALKNEREAHENEAKNEAAG